jgi:hypothetical protein
MEARRQREALEHRVARLLAADSLTMVQKLGSTFEKVRCSAAISFVSIVALNASTGVAGRLCRTS